MDLVRIVGGGKKGNGAVTALRFWIDMIRKGKNEVPFWMCQDDGQLK